MTTVTILADNEVKGSRPKGLGAEWGFAAAIDDLLFDAGQTGVAADNAAKLDAGPFETIVLSHGHYDHTKGLPPFLDAAEELYCHPAAFDPKYHGEESIGMPYARSWIDSQVSVTTHREPIDVSPGIDALGEIPREFPDNRTGETLDETGRRIEDPVRDDQALVVETGDGVSLVLGCCHAGLRNTIVHAESMFEASIETVVGGTHLRSPDPDELAETASWLADRIDRIAPTHCTSHAARTILAEEFGDDYEHVGAGSTVTL